MTNPWDVLKAGIEAGKPEVAVLAGCLILSVLAAGVMLFFDPNKERARQASVALLVVSAACVALLLVTWPRAPAEGEPPAEPPVDSPSPQPPPSPPPSPPPTTPSSAAWLIDYPTEQAALQAGEAALGGAGQGVKLRVEQRGDGLHVAVLEGFPSQEAARAFCRTRDRCVVP